MAESGRYGPVEEMPRVHFSIALAASSNRLSRENRATEVLGTVLESHLGFANLLLTRLNLPTADQVEVWSQVDLGSHGRPDLVLRAKGPNGSAVVFFEHKEPVGGAAWQPDQPTKYVRALRNELRAGGSGKLFVIASAEQAEKRVRSRVRGSDRGSALQLVAELREGTHAGDRPLTEYATWQEVAGVAFEAGQEAAAGDRDWLATARKADAPSSQRLLAELIWYLEEEGYGMTKALDPDAISQASSAFEFIESIEQLTQDVGERITARDAATGLIRVRGAYDTFRAPSTSWVERFGGRLYTGWDQATESACAHIPSLKTGELIFIVGAYASSDGLRALDRKADWQEQARSAGLYIEDGDILAAYDAKAVQALETLDQQGGELARWTADRVKAILALKPGRAPAKAPSKADGKTGASRRKHMRRG